MPVDRCVCHSVTFETLKALSAREGLGLAELAKKTGCCTGCSTCTPYVRLMLKTGHTVFPVLNRWQFEHVLGKGCCEFSAEELVQKESGPLPDAKVR